MSEITKDALQYLWERGKNEAAIIDVDKHRFAPAHLNLKEIQPDVLPPAPPLKPVFDVQTLTGFIGLIQSGLEGITPDSKDLFVHVLDETTIELVNVVSDKWGRRQVLAKCSAFDYEKFPFDVQQSQTNFLIQLQSRFVPDEAIDSDYTYLLQVASNLTASTVTVSDDNGISQEAVIKTSTTGRKDIAIRQRVNLAPYRTFTEIEQPESPFILRLWKQGSDQNPAIPNLSLTEADGNSWKKEAMNRIGAYLREEQAILVIC